MSTAHEGCLRAVADAIRRGQKRWLEGARANRGNWATALAAVAAELDDAAIAASPAPEASGMPTKFHKMRCLCTPCNEDATAIRAERDAALRRAEKAEVDTDILRRAIESARSNLTLAYAATTDPARQEQGEKP